MDVNEKIAAIYDLVVTLQNQLNAYTTYANKALETYSRDIGKLHDAIHELKNRD